MKLYNNRTELLKMVRRYLDGKATAEEQKFLEAYDRFLEKDPGLLGSLSPEEMRLLEEKLEAGIWAAIEREERPKVRSIWYRPLRIAVAASLLMLLSVGGYFYLHRAPVQQIAHNQAEQISPAQQGVVLTIAKDRQIALDPRNNGRLVTLSGASVSQAGRVLKYQETPKADALPQSNILTNNSGDKFSVTLADGTVAVLDIGSSLTYPVAFAGKERAVSMTGQVYFKVKHNASQPFKVLVANEEVQDIGTEFNINAYADEPALSTTLVEGAVEVVNNGRSVLLKPGEQTLLTGDALEKNEANIEQVTAWLQGKLVFRHQTLESIMRQVGRIYDVRVVWQDAAARKLSFGGSVSRTKKLSTILDYFRKAGQVDFAVDGKTVTVFTKKSSETTLTINPK
ncbi:MAG TPA: FecR domain-containing protein [Mucilaginibacter sp.]